VTLIEHGQFTLHSGRHSDYRIDCRALSDDDIESLASMVARRFRFRSVHSIPRGGDRLGRALEKYALPDDHNAWDVLLVDDVMTTGISMNTARADLEAYGYSVIGVVIFGRACGVDPDWINPIFHTEWF
jgi:orotate phosphoribosyltransferase